MHFFPVQSYFDTAKQNMNLHVTKTDEVIQPIF